jgi:acylglycerol lipase
VNQLRISSLFSPLLIYLVLIFAATGQVLADECVRNEAVPSASIGVRCTEDPSCVIVGETHMLEWKSANSDRIVVVCIHGLGLCARAYKPLAQELSVAGIDGFGVNVRGFGPDRDKPDRAKLNCLKTVSDVSALLTNIHKEYPGYRVFLIGESMGGALAIRIAATNPDLVDGVVCSAPAWKLLKIRRTALKGVFELVLYPGAEPGPAGRSVMQQATSDPGLTKHWLQDPSHKLKLSLGEARAFMSFISDTDAYARRLGKPVLIIQGLNDHLVSSRAVARMFRDLPSKNKTFLIVGNGEHLVLEEGRFSPALTAKLTGWLKNNSTVQSTPSSVEVIDDQSLLPDEKQHLLRLQRLTGAPPR